MKIIIYIFIIVLFCLSTSLYGQDIKADSFAGIKWGAAPDSAPGINFVDYFGNKDFKQYRIPGKEVNLGGLTHSDIKCVFWKDRLIEADIQNIPPKHEKMLVQYLTGHWGKTSRERVKDISSSYYWETSQIEISLFRFRDRMSISVKSAAIIDLRENQERSQDIQDGLYCQYDLYHKNCFQKNSIDKIKNNFYRVKTKSVDISEDYEMIETETVDINCLDKLMRSYGSNGTFYYLRGKPQSATTLKDEDWSPITKLSYYNFVHGYICGKKNTE